MKKELLILFLIMVIFSNISALCEEGQIDINSASKEELDSLYGIGPAKAEAIINARPFQGVDNLIEVVGIGEVTLTKIKQQDLACVKGEEENTQEEEEIVEEENIQEQEDIQEEEPQVEETEPIIKETQKITVEEVKTINLNTKDIKSENSKELNKGKLAIYGIITFCLLLITLFMLKKEKYKKNEFR
ncbi:MAG: helix-hairpin-helix domain-containing protein [Candidatus Diapherotrites archaeon]